MLKLFEGAMLIGGFVLYLIPAMEADARERDNALAITMVNVLLGWTIVGWFAALKAARSPSGERRLPHVGLRIRRATARATIDKLVAHARNCSPFGRAATDARRTTVGACA
ncbi:superinfection immunity protein [Trinickia terrae]|uniref:Superinfection immunity protein n=1 Tax=Trinickia terrae TaxID=2571161 RepID=A0A4V6WQA3_9BURK|nr:superinfection immunity protein [Trinickia terrae]TKC88290.1 superinfection immunity protein [Trinickia terrae]